MSASRLYWRSSFLLYEIVLSKIKSSTPNKSNVRDSRSFTLIWYIRSEFVSLLLLLPSATCSEIKKYFKFMGEKQDSLEQSDNKYLGMCGCVCQMTMTRVSCMRLPGVCCGRIEWIKKRKMRDEGASAVISEPLWDFHATGDPPLWAFLSFCFSFWLNYRNKLTQFELQKSSEAFRRS